MLGGKWSKYCSLALFSTNHQKDTSEKMWGWPWDGPPLAKMQKAINSRQILCILLAIPELKSPELAVLPPPEEPQKINPFSFEAFIMEIWDRIRPGGLLLCSTSSRGNSWSLLTEILCRPSVHIRIPDCHKKTWAKKQPRKTKSFNTWFQPSRNVSADGNVFQTKYAPVLSLQSYHRHLSPCHWPGCCSRWGDTSSCCNLKKTEFVIQGLTSTLLSHSGKRCVKVLVRDSAEFSAGVSSLLLIKESASWERQYPLIKWVVAVMLDAVSAFN